MKRNTRGRFFEGLTPKRQTTFSSNYISSKCYSIILAATGEKWQR